MQIIYIETPLGFLATLRVDKLEESILTLKRLWWESGVYLHLDAAEAKLRSS